MQVLGRLSLIDATAGCRSTLSYANSKWPYKLQEDFYYVIPEKLNELSTTGVKTE